MSLTSNPIALVRHHVVELSQAFPQWMENYDQIHFPEATQAEMIDLLATAPTGFAAGLVYGKMAARISYEAARPRMRQENFRLITSPTQVCAPDDTHEVARNSTTPASIAA